MHRLIKAGETTDARQTVYFDLRQPDGITPCTTEASGQPQVSTDGASWTNTGIGTLTHIGNGRYSAVLTDTITGIANVGKVILTRYYNASTTPETPGDSVELVAYDPALGANGVLAGQAQAGGNTTITLASGDSATDNYYRGATVHLIGGTGADQIRTIVSYVGSTKVATIDFAWATNPDSTSNYRLSSTRSPAMDTSLRVALGSTGLDAISTTAPSGVASNYREMMVQLWRRFFKKAARSTSQILTYADDGTTVLTTQSISDDGSGNEAQGASS